ncbi:hypothetical protein SCACP_16730 [Sporomusa carbonis]|uniref:hypothetical protein n=1 Tax=Sporomusa carbonis TaxID=3076075 RepID=UPI003A6CBC10
MYAWAMLVLIILVVMWSIWLRVCCSRVSLDNMPQVEPRPSPFSNAVQDLVSTAGGVYLSLVLIVSFLKIELPERITIGILSFDPLAMTSIGLAVIQPMFSKIFGNK